MNKNYKISIVTPCYNSEKYIEKCILSIKNQTYCNFEHIIVDGGSTDDTINIIKKYDGLYPMKWISEKDNGMYDAINKGFKLATGDVFAWINSDDYYMPWAFEIMNLIMQCEEVKWCTMASKLFADKKGLPYFINRTFGPISYSQAFLRKGYYNGQVLGYIQQEATFWRRELWEVSGGLESKYRYAGDYWLWVKFSKYEPLFSANTIISVFRRHEGQLSQNIKEYQSELPKMTVFQKILAKTKILLLVSALFHPSHKYLIQPETIQEGDIL